MNPAPAPIMTQEASSRARCFVMQPFGRRTNPRTGEEVDNDKIYEALKTLQLVRPSFAIDVFRADTKQYSKADLHSHVIECIRLSDFCVADFTGQNPNVIYETGFARGLKREVIVVCQDRADVPTDLKELITVPYRMDDLQHLGSDIDQHLDRVVLAVDELRKAAGTQIQYFSERDDTFIRERIRTANAHIDILQTNLSTIQASYISDLLDAMRVNPRLKLRILTLNPQSIFVNFRGQQLGFAENIALYRGELDAALKGVHFQLLQFGTRTQIKVYDDFPTQLGFYFDTEILACVVSATGRSRRNCAFLLSSAMPGTKHSFVDHFEYLWDEKNGKCPLFPELMVSWGLDVPFTDRTTPLPSVGGYPYSYCEGR
jgi:hypothetical protein